MRAKAVRYSVMAEKQYEHSVIIKQRVRYSVMAARMTESGRPICSTAMESSVWPAAVCTMVCGGTVRCVGMEVFLVLEMETKEAVCGRGTGLKVRGRAWASCR